jgi:hypothetical protein
MSEAADLITFPDHPGRGRHSAAYKRNLRGLAADLQKVDSTLDFKMSARGWGYYLEGEGAITKGEINRAEKVINDLRDTGALPLDFTAYDDARLFQQGGGLDRAGSVDSYIRDRLEILRHAWGYDPSFWDAQDYYIMVIVEKVDLRELFADTCENFNIPIANAKGWSPKNLRGELLKRSYQAIQRSQEPVILYFGDYDPGGVQISDTLPKNLHDLSGAKIPAGDGEYITGDVVDNMIERIHIHRFGLNRETIDELELAWINNLETGSGKDLAAPSHPDHDQDYVQDWLREVGERKVEANAILKATDDARSLFQDVITEFLGESPHAATRDKQRQMRKAVKTRLNELGVTESMEEALAEMGGDDE